MVKKIVFLISILLSGLLLLPLFTGNIVVSHSKIYATSTPEIIENCGKSTKDKEVLRCLEWFPAPLPGWKASAGEIFLHTDSILQVHRLYKRLSDGAELEILILAINAASGEHGDSQGFADSSWEKIAIVMGGKTFYCQGYKGILLAREGKTVLKFILPNRHLEIDLMLNRMDSDTVKRYGSLLDIKKAVQVYRHWK